MPQVERRAVGPIISDHMHSGVVCILYPAPLYDGPLVQSSSSKIYAHAWLFYTFVLFSSSADDVGRPTFKSATTSSVPIAGSIAGHSRDRDEERGAAGAGLKFIKRVHKLRLSPSCPTQGWPQLRRVARREARNKSKGLAQVRTPCRVPCAMVSQCHGSTRQHEEAKASRGVR